MVVALLLVGMLAFFVLKEGDPLKVYPSYPSIYGRVILEGEEVELAVTQLTQLTERAALLTLRARGLEGVVWELRFSNGSVYVASAPELSIAQGNGSLCSLRVRGIAHSPEVAIQLDAHVFTRGSPLPFSRGIPVISRLDWERQIYGAALLLLSILVIVLLILLLKRRRSRGEGRWRWY